MSSSTQPLLTQFQTYLTGSKQLSDSSIKNYVSDINHFFNFLTTTLKIKQKTIESKHITLENCQQYEQHLQANNASNTPTPTSNTPTPTSNTPTPTSNTPATTTNTLSANTPATTSTATINRRLSSLRRFGDFLQTTNKLNNNPTQANSSIIQQPNLKQIIDKYQQHLKQQNLSPITIKNYLSDLKIYLLWAQEYAK